MADGADKAVALRGAIGTAAFAQRLADVRASNDSIKQAAPGDLRATVDEFYDISLKAMMALDSSASQQQRLAAVTAAREAATSPSGVAAIAAFKQWVTANCGSLSTKILTVS